MNELFGASVSELGIGGILFVLSVKTWIERKSKDLNGLEKYLDKNTEALHELTTITKVNSEILRMVADDVRTQKK